MRDHRALFLPFDLKPRDIPGGSMEIVSPSVTATCTPDALPPRVARSKIGQAERWRANPYLSTGVNGEGSKIEQVTAIADMRGKR
jgi:hypothetical protein